MRSAAPTVKQGRDQPNVASSKQRLAKQSLPDQLRRGRCRPRMRCMPSKLACAASLPARLAGPGMANSQVPGCPAGAQQHHPVARMRLGVVVTVLELAPAFRRRRSNLWTSSAARWGQVVFWFRALAPWRHQQHEGYFLYAAQSCGCCGVFARSRPKARAGYLVGSHGAGYHIGALAGAHRCLGAGFCDHCFLASTLLLDACRMARGHQAVEHVKEVESYC